MSVACRVTAKNTLVCNLHQNVEYGPESDPVYSVNLPRGIDIHAGKTTMSKRFWLLANMNIHQRGRFFAEVQESFCVETNFSSGRGCRGKSQ